MGENTIPKTWELGPLVEAPHLIIDSDTVNIREARFILPAFVLHAIPRLFSPKYRHLAIDERYEAIKKKFTDRFQLMMPVPLVYKYVVLKTCLDAY